MIIPTYNEKDNLELVVSGIFELGLADLSILVVDDGSPDGTGAVADRLSDRYPGKLHVLHREGKLGLGTAYLEGFRFGIARGFEALCEMDADGSHEPAALRDLVAAVSGGADVAIGSRRVPGGRIVGWGPHRHLMSWGAMTLSRLALGLKTRDVTAGFRCYRARVVEELLRRPISSNGYAFQEETIFYCEKLGFRIAEIPVTFRDRVRGGSKLSKKEIIAFFTTIRRLRRLDLRRLKT